MEMMPIMNVFNEWHAANTSKKIRAVKRANAKEGIYCAKKAAYGYIKGTDKKRTPVIDEETAPIVRRIFEMYASGISTKKIAEMFTEEKVPSPAVYAYEKYGQKGKPNPLNIWQPSKIRDMLHDIIYIGHMPQLKMTSVSYKNHKRYRTDKNDWIIVYNNHEPIISQELWDKVQERHKSPVKGKRTKTGYVHPLSGFVYCKDCGQKMKMSSHRNKNGKLRYAYNCGYYERYGKVMCFSHYISAKDLEQVVLEDIQDTAKYIILDEKTVREDFMRHNAELTDNAVKTAQKELKTKRKRLEELSRLMQVAYEDRVKGKMPEEICLNFIRKYSDEQRTLTEEIAATEEKITDTESAAQNVDKFINDIKKYYGVPELTREMCYELIDRIVVGATPKTNGEDRLIEIVYKADMSSVLKHRFEKK
ncbi:MAG: recombinase family protein, partial [Corallococcus sp.]|nr:recombinase family protein [Corallococcus sp.]